MSQYNAIDKYMYQERKIKQWRDKKQKEEQAAWKKKHCTSKVEYSRYLLDPRWLNRRNYIFGIRGEICMNCNSTENLHIHHIKYTGKYPWLAPDEDLICLCKECHNKAHNGEIDCEELIKEFNDREDNVDLVLCFKNNNFISEMDTDKAVEKFGKGVIKCCEGTQKTCKLHTFMYAKQGKKPTESKEVVKKLKPLNERVYDIIKITDEEADTLYEEGLLTEKDFRFISSIYSGKNLTPKQIYVLEQIAERTSQYEGRIIYHKIEPDKNDLDGQLMARMGAYQIEVEILPIKK